MSAIITITDPLKGNRQDEPVSFAVPGDLREPLRWARTEAGEKVLLQRLREQPRPGETAFATVVSFDRQLCLEIGEPVADPPEALEGIRELSGRESDSFARLDTGAFVLELCSGKAEGLGSSKWGIRHFKGHFDDFELLPSGNNAIGGFYGPFFTPENGLINPPEHTKVEIDIVERGPLLHRYRMRGVIPDGLLDELKGKHFSIDWTFFHRAPFFQRKYLVDNFSTVINGRSVTNKITVGDEFEGGPGELVFDRFEAYGGTRYRAGDPYAGELVAMVAETVSQTLSHGQKFEEFRTRLSDIESAHWDLYWRLFCIWEQVLGEDEIRNRLARVRAAAHVKADLDDRPWILTDEPVDVSSTPHETIFPGPASKTVEYDNASGRAMVWWTSKPSGAFQIVQRRQSGWVNWGSNGENECPELPIGVDIKTAYGPFAANWRTMADKLELAPTVEVREIDPSNNPEVAAAIAAA